MSTQAAPGSETVVEERTQPSFQDGDAERFSHYVPKAKLTDAIAKVDAAIAAGRQAQSAVEPEVRLASAGSVPNWASSDRTSSPTATSASVVRSCSTLATCG